MGTGKSYQGNNTSCPADCYLQCGGPVQTSGGGTFTLNFHGMPTEAGTVTFSYNAYSIPDRFVVKIGQTTMVDTGMNSGSGTVQFEKPQGTAVVTVTVTSNDSNTAWEYSISCPENPLP